MANEPDERQVGDPPFVDPTRLTTEALYREVGKLSASIEHEVAEIKDIVEGEVRHLDEKLVALDARTAEQKSDTKDALDGALVAQKEASTHERELIEEKFRSVETQNEERFSSVGRQFSERDVRADAITVLNKTALDAAFSAQKEAAREQNKSNTLAISKSETATSETINKLAELFKTTTDGLADKIDDLKSRVGAIDATMVGFIERGAGARQNVVDTRQSGVDSRAVLASFIGVALFLVTVAGFVIALATKH